MLMAYLKTYSLNRQRESIKIFTALDGSKTIVITRALAVYCAKVSEVLGRRVKIMSLSHMQAPIGVHSDISVQFDHSAPLICQYVTPRFLRRGEPSTRMKYPAY